MCVHLFLSLNQFRAGYYAVHDVRSKHNTVFHGQCNYEYKWVNDVYNCELCLEVTFTYGKSIYII